MRRVRLIAVGLVLLGLAACDDVRYPRDPEGTLERVLSTGSMRVIAVDHVPWVIVDGGGAPRGAEADLVQAFARELGATIEWRRAPAFTALNALKSGEADLAIGGFTKDLVSAHKGAGYTFPYFMEALVVAANRGASIPQSLRDHKVHAAPELFANNLIQNEGGVPEGGVPVSDRAENAPLVALPAWQVPARNLVPAGIVLRREERVMAVPQGENAWVMRLERFLRKHREEVPARLREHAP